MSVKTNFSHFVFMVKEEFERPLHYMVEATGATLLSKLKEIIDGRHTKENIRKVELSCVGTDGLYTDWPADVQADEALLKQLFA